MTTPPVVERRIGQRFPFNLPVALRDVASGAEGVGFTQDLSSRGAFLLTDMKLDQGADVELTLEMPSEITLGENMRVRCRGRVLRVVKRMDSTWSPGVEVASPAPQSAGAAPSLETASVETVETKIGVAVCLSGYEYLPETQDGSAAFRRISPLHSSSEAERPEVPVPAGPQRT